MKRFFDFLKGNFSFVLLSAFFLFSVFNPVFKKYDYGAEFPLVLLFCVILSVLAVVEFKKNRERSIWEKLFLIIFVLSVISSFYFSQTKNVGLSEVLAFISMSVLYFIFAHKKNNFRETFLKVIGISAILAVVLGYIIYFIEPETRMFGPFFNTFYHANVWPNAFCLFLLLVWPVFLILKKWNVKTALILGFVISGILLTYSRGGLIVFGGQLLLIFVYFARKISLKNVLLIILTVFISLGLFFGANYLRALQYDVIDIEERATFGNDEGLTSKQERVDFWLGAIQLINEKPLTGWGPFSFRYAYNPIQKTLLGSSDHPHNVFLKIGVENGLIALGAFVAFLISVFVVVCKRFSLLSGVKKDFVFVLGVSVLGAFAHNLIDYNLNFLANLFLLFLFICFIRSVVIVKYKPKKAFVGILFAFLIAGVSIYEGAILVLNESVFDHSFSGDSLYPRNYYLNVADTDLNQGSYDYGVLALDKQLSLNPLDSRAYYLKGVFYCDEKNPARNFPLCKENLAKAVELNPMNDWSYYLDYFRVLEKIGTDSEIDEFVAKVLPLLNRYFDYVMKNVHFTAYTQNVEASAELADRLFYFVDRDVAKSLIERKEKMFAEALNFRGEKVF